MAVRFVMYLHGRMDRNHGARRASRHAGRGSNTKTALDHGHTYDWRLGAGRSGLTELWRGIVIVQYGAFVHCIVLLCSNGEAVASCFVAGRSHEQKLHNNSIIPYTYV